MISPEPMSGIAEALWEAGEQFGRRLSVPDQVAVARRLERRGTDELTIADIRKAFEDVGLTPPAPSFARAMLNSLRRFAPRPSLRDLLVDYRQFAIGALSGQFGGKTKGREEELRNNLLTFLLPRGYTEARTGRGRTDILLPSPQAIIEVKVWGGVQSYEDGLEELSRYIHTERPKVALMVVFGDREPLPEIVRDQRQEIAEERELEGLVVPVIVVPFEVDQASKAAQLARRRARDGQ